MRWRIVDPAMRSVPSLASAGATRAAVTVERVRYRGWDDAWRLSNGAVDLVVVPSVARIMRYGFVGGPNVLWENPTVAGQPARLGDWPNIGGDKPWPWPQDEWPQRTGRAWPPPAAADQAPYAVDRPEPGMLRLRSTLVAGYGLRIVRDVRLADAGTQVTLRTRFEKVREGAAFPVAVWTVTQMPVPDYLLARLTPGSSLARGYKLLSTNPWKIVSREEGRYLLLRRSGENSAKVGIDADLLAWVKDDLLFTERSVAGREDRYAPGERAQIYAHPDDPSDQARGILPYVELEMTSPLRTLRRGESQTLQVVWDLSRLPAGQREPSSVIRRLP